MRLVILAFVMLVAVSCNEQANNEAAQTALPEPAQTIGENDNFDHLKELIIDSAKAVKVYYNPGVTDIINRVISNNDFLYDENTPGDKRVMTTKVDTSKKQSQLLVFSYGVDQAYPLFGFFSNDVTMNFIGPVPGTEIYIPGDGKIYTKSWQDNSSDRLEVFRLSGDTLIHSKNNL